MLAIFTTGLLLASWLDVPAVAGVAFLAGCFIAARYTDPSHLLGVVVSPPLLFLCALIPVTAVTWGGGLAATAGDSLLMLGGNAPWLFAGTAVAAALAWLRGPARRFSQPRRNRGRPPG